MEMGHAFQLKVDWNLEYYLRLKHFEWSALENYDSQRIEIRESLLRETHKTA